jgi:hypothetical protein
MSMLLCVAGCQGHQATAPLLLLLLLLLLCPGIKAIKLMAWEEPYLSRITALRDAELAAIRKR